MAAPTSKPSSEYLRIGELAERASVSVATIKYYIREGLLPPPPVKTGRTMGYYDQAYLARLTLIRSLREDHYLPLRVIRQILTDRGDRPFTADEAALLARVGPAVLKRLEPDEGPRVGRAEVMARYEVGAEELDLMGEMGLLAGQADYGPPDLQLLDALAHAEKAGITRARFPVEGLGHYVELLDELAKREVRVFAHRAAGLPADEVLQLAQLAVEVSEPIVALIRKKFILRAIRERLAEEARKALPSEGRSLLHDGARQEPQIQAHKSRSRNDHR